MRHLLRTPVFASEESTQRARIFHRVMWLITATTSLLLAAETELEERRIAERRLEMALDAGEIGDEAVGIVAKKSMLADRSIIDPCAALQPSRVSAPAGRP